MRLLFDEQLSEDLVKVLGDLFPDPFMFAYLAPAARLIPMSGSSRASTSAYWSPKTRIFIA